MLLCCLLNNNAIGGDIEGVLDNFPLKGPIVGLSNNRTGGRGCGGII